MRNPLERIRLWRAQRRFTLRTRVSPLGTTAKFAGIVTVLIIAAAALLEMRRGGGAEGDLVAYAQADGADPLDLVQIAGRSRRLLFLADIRSAPAPKRFAAQAIERLASTSGLDLLVLDIDADEQRYIDLYLATSPEDASILLARPRALREQEGESRMFLDIYRMVWRINDQLGADRRIRILAADIPGWPPVRSTSPGDAAERYSTRDTHMLRAVMDRGLSRAPNARVLFLVDGLHTLKSGGARIQTGGARGVEVKWLAAQLAAYYPQDVYSIIIDAAPSRVIDPDVAAFRGTAFADIMRRASVRGSTALRVDQRFDAVSRRAIRVVDPTGIDFNLEPRSAPLSQLADAYIYFGN